MRPTQISKNNLNDTKTVIKSNIKKPQLKRKLHQQGGRTTRSATANIDSAVNTNNISTSDKNEHTETNDINIDKLIMTGKQYSKRTKKDNSSLPSTSAINTHNSFEILSNLEDGEDLDDMEITQEQQDDVTNKKEKPPPPIVIHGQTKQHKDIVQLLKGIIKSEFTIRYTSKNINVTINNRQDRQKFITYLENKKTSFHTYTDTTEKTHAFVIRGLAEDVTTEDIEKELTETHKIPVKKCYKMSNINRPLYLLITDSTITIKQLETHVRNIAYTRVKFERRRNTRKITQCHRCQAWGHATSNCRGPITCMFCATNHWTRDCPNKEKTPKCSNCSGTHQSNSPDCSVYTQRVDWIKKQQDRQNKPTNDKPGLDKNKYTYNDTHYPPLQYKEAPQPKNNVWTGRELTTTTTTTVDLDTTGQQQPTPGRIQSHNHDTQQRAPCANNGNSPMSYQQPIDSFKELMNEFTTLHTLVNIRGITKAVRDLNALLKQCNTKEDKFQTFTLFTSNLTNYDI